MAFFTIKHINGRDYLYRQESYREGGQVRSRSQYICPIDPAVATQFKATRSRFGVLDIKATAEDVQDVVESLLPNPEAPETKSRDVHSNDCNPLILWRELDGETKALWVDRKTGEILKEKTSIFNTTKSTENPPSEFEKADTPKTPAKPDTTFRTLAVSANVEKHGISRTAIEGAHRQLLKQMKADGLNTTNIPRIKIGYSIAAKVEVYRRFTGGYRVTVPLLKRSAATKALSKLPDRRTKSGRRAPMVYQEPTKGVRSDFWREYRRALALTYLDALETQNPEKFKSLRNTLKPLYQEQNAAISSYIKNTNMNNRLGLTLQFRQNGHLSGWIKSHLSAGHFGLPDHKARKDWKADCAALMAENPPTGI